MHKFNAQIQDALSFNLHLHCTVFQNVRHFRFKTSRPSGLILATSCNEKAMNHLILSLEAGRIKITLNMGEGNKIVHLGRDLNDDRWHSLKIERRGPSLEMKLDTVTQMAEITGQLISLHISQLMVGSLDKELVKSISPSLYHSTKDVPNYVGSIQQFTLNHNNYFEMARHGQLGDYNATANFGKKDVVIHAPVTFKSRHTFVGLAQLKAYSTVNIHFQFKTLLANGLILYNAGKGQDFLAVELVSGHLNYIFNLGDGPRRVRSTSRNSLNGNTIFMTHSRY